MDPQTASSIAGLSWFVRLFKWQIATVLIIGFLSLALAGWAIYSYQGGQECNARVFFEKTPYRELILKGRDKLTEAEKQQYQDGIEFYNNKLEECRRGWSAWRWLTMIEPIPSAYAQAKIGGYGPDEVRLGVVMVIFSTLSIFFFVCVAALLFSRNPAVISFASDSVKSLLGFFLGVGMSFMGIAK